jgi:hypothetical protein
MEESAHVVINARYFRQPTPFIFNSKGVLFSRRKLKLLLRRAVVRPKPVAVVTPANPAATAAMEESVPVRNARSER